MAAAALHVSLIVLVAVVSLTDLRSRVIPDLALLAALALALPVAALSDTSALPERMGAATGAAGFLLAAALMRPDGMGLGDVKLAGVLGFYLGAGVVAALLVAFAAGSLAGLVLLARYGWEARHRTIPFAPFLGAGALAAMVAQP